jgi:dihydrofolate synthase/folylpolyglutamate synthase
MIAACLTAAGFRTGLYTSPHLVDFRERIRIDGVKIPRSRLAAATRRLKPAIVRTNATFFEAATAIAFSWFAEAGVDIAVIETGLGGRWDSTNVITPLVSVITSIGLEHREYLGNTVRKIAFEKAGIIKPGVPCVIGEIGGGALDVIRRRAAALGSKVVRAPAATSVANVRPGGGGLTADFRVGTRILDDLRLDARGRYQETNARTALQALETLGSAHPGFAVGERAIRRGLGALSATTGLAGRLHFLARTPPVILDVAHNPDGVAALVESLRAIRPGKYTVVFGAVREKDYRRMIDLLAPVARMFCFVRARSDRSRDPRDLLEHAHDRRVPARLGGTVTEGIRLAASDSPGGEPLLVTGSHFVVGEGLTAFRVRP